MYENKIFSTWVEIALDAIQGNVRLVRQQTGKQIMAVVKANGYGHGALAVARAALDGGATWCGVARVEEALELRQAGVGCPILLLSWTPPEQIHTAISHRISMTVWTQEQITWISAEAKRLDMQARLHLKIDTGMGRVGVQREFAPELARRLSDDPDIFFEGLFTHFARADEADPTTTVRQEALFRHLLAELEPLGLRPPLVHAANSAASVTRPSAHFDLLRLGIAMYGLNPSEECRLPPGFRPALSWKAVLSQVKTLLPGSGISYGHEYVTRNHERIGTIPVGYADGFRRNANNQVLVGGKVVPVVGRVCMDQTLVQLDQVPEAKVMDEVTIIGVQGDQRISAEDVASRWGTNNYDVVCGIGARVPRLYV
jgi:alanine racemase